jgi:hypothetical protein
MLVLLVGCAAFVAVAIYVLPIAPVTAYSAIVFFGLGIVVALLQMLPDSAYLEIDERGFTTCTMFRKSFVPWENVGEFFPLSLDPRARKMVAFHYAPGYKAHPAGRKLLTALAGAEAALPDIYGRSAEDLARLLNTIRGERVPARS